MTAIELPSREDGFTSNRAAVSDEWLPLLVFLLVQAAAWIAIPANVYTGLPSNTLELALWARDWFIVNYKHPALSAWMLGFTYDIFGTHVWVSLLLAQACIVTTYVFVFLIGRDLMGTRAALFGALLLPAVSYFTLGTLKYNHNIAQLPLWAGFCVGLWRASRSDRWSWWVFTALMAALGFYAKFTMVLVVAFGALWMLLDGEARSRLNGRAPYIALLVFIVLLLPLAVALGMTDFVSVKWISRESAKRGIPGLHFLRHVGITVLFMTGAMIVGLGLNRLPLPRIHQAPALQKGALRFLFVMGGGPMLLTLVLALLKPSRLEWSAPMYSLIGLLLTALVLRFRLQQSQLTQAGFPHVILALIATLGVLGVHTEAALQDRATGFVDRMLLPTMEIGSRFDRLWEEETGKPLRIVGGDGWTGGAVGLMSSGHPSLFTDLNPQLSPAITASRIQREGVLVVWMKDSSWRPDPTLVAHFPHGSQTFVLGPKAANLTINYMVISPGLWTEADSEQWLEHGD